ncbi:MAG: hypothetical protein K8S97_13785 [Anaerolineae bacterium]|nr:hypothetical protein [Anaerolineae bacterium]
MSHKRIRIVLCLVLLLALILTACGSDDEDQVVEKQSYKVGVLLTTPMDYMVSNALTIELENLGYVEGENVEYVIQLAKTPAEIDETLAGFVAAEVDVIYTASAGDAHGALGHTNDIPIVFASGIDELVELLRVPHAVGARVTGITLGDVTTRRLDFLLKIDPSIEVVYAPYDPTNEVSAAGFALLNEVAPQLDVEIVGAKATDIATTQQAADAMPDNVDALFLWTERFAIETWGIWTELALERQLPTSVDTANIEVLDFLMGYGPNFDTTGAQSARIVDRVLHGDPANEIPFEPNDPALAVNLEVADMIALDVSDTILAQASVIVRAEEADPSFAATGDEVEGACMTVLLSPLGATAACVDTPCEALIDTTLITFEEKVEAEDCALDGVIGVCTVDGSSTFFLEGAVDVLANGCTITGGEWTALIELDGAGATDESAAAGEADGE